MKVILLRDTQNVGRKYDVKNVTDGFAQNLLIPKGLAILATASTIKTIELKKKQQEEDQKVSVDLLLKNFKSLHGASVEITAPTNEKGHLFSGIHKTEILNALKKKHLEIPEEAITLSKPIKEIGAHTIEFGVGSTKGTFILNISALKE